MQCRSVKPLIFLCLACFCLQAALAQGPSKIPAGELDPTLTVAHPRLFSSFHKPLPEQYIWTREDSAVSQTTFIRYQHPGLNDKTAPHYFRTSFNVSAVPKNATLYLAGPRSVTAYVNGTLAGHVAGNNLNPLGMHVFQMDVTHLLKPGQNVLALQVVRGRGVHGFLNSALAMQQVFGEILVAKIVPDASGVDAPAILISGPQWKGTLHAPSGWQRPDYDDSAWPSVAALSPIEGSIDLFQWNADAGLYDWPGYEGASPFLAHMYLPATKVDDVQTGRGSFENLDSLTEATPSSDFAVKLDGIAPGGEFAPEITLDFGREVNGRVEFVSDSGSQAVVSIQYGESKEAADNEPYLGVNVLRIPPQGSAHGPKSAFRYARIRFLAGGPSLQFKTIHLEDIYYPVKQEGSFESSDPLLNRIWETGAYTVHLCMQDDIWDAPKRDRGRWMGDTDISGHVSDTIFFDHSLLKDTLSRLIGDDPVQQHVNGIPGYSSFWFTELQNYERHTGDAAYLRQVHTRLVQLLGLMDKEFNAQNQFIDRTGAWLFVDWAPELNGDTPETRIATTMEYARAYLAGASLLRQAGDNDTAAHFESRAAQLKQALQQSAWSQADGDFGPRWQTNAMAVISGVANPSQYPSIWTRVLSHVGESTIRPNVITPYYGAYVLDAMAKMNHRADALKWIRQYWGGMIDEGATSFWEGYDPAWPRSNPHANLQADNSTGYFVSLAHGWSSGPTYWLMEQVLGIRPIAEGFTKTIIRPDLIDLKWARGKEPTPHGLLKVDIRNQNGMVAAIDLPEGVNATVLFPITKGASSVTVNGAPRKGALAENGSRVAITLDQPGHYDLH